MKQKCYHLPLKPGEKLEDGDMIFVGYGRGWETILPEHVGTVVREGNNYLRFVIEEIEETK